MPDKFVISGVKPYDGEYELDLTEESFTYLEWRWIKKISGYLPLTMQAGWEGGDPDLMLALTLVAMHRADRIEESEVMRVAERLEKEQFGGTQITFVPRDAEEAAEADPPAQAPPPDEATGAQNANGGTSSTPPTSPQEDDLSRTGHPVSGTPTLVQVSDRETLAS